MHSSHATPVPLRHRTAWYRLKIFVSIGIRCVPRSHRPAADTIAGCRRQSRGRVRRGHHARTPLGPPMRHTHARAFFSPEEDHSLHEPREQPRLLSRPKAHGPPRRARPPGVSDDGTRGNVAHGNENGKRFCEYFPILVFTRFDMRVFDDWNQHHAGRIKMVLAEFVGWPFTAF